MELKCHTNTDKNGFYVVYELVVPPVKREAFLEKTSKLKEYICGSFDDIGGIASSSGGG
jgi:hypothetical protein